MAGKSTIKDVAKRASVSVTTVSQVLNGKGDRFSQATRDRVMAASNALDYVPDFNARNLIMKHATSIGVLIPNLGNPFFSTFIRGIQDQARKKGYMPLIFGASHDDSLERYYLEELIKRGVDGLIIASASITAETIEGLVAARHIPYVLFDQNGVSQGIQLRIDDYTGGQMAAQHLIDEGHKKITIVAPKIMTENMANRINGFTDTLRAAGITVDPAARVNAPLSKVGGYEATEAVIATKPTAVFAINDEMAIGLMRGLHEHHLRVPKELSVMGYDDIDLDEYVQPRLTTIRQPVFEMGILATSLLINRINQEPEKQPDIDLSLRLIVRQSTTKPNE